MSDILEDAKVWLRSAGNSGDKTEALVGIGYALIAAVQELNILNDNIDSNKTKEKK